MERPCFLSNHIKPPCTEDRGRTIHSFVKRLSVRFCGQNVICAPPTEDGKSETTFKFKFHNCFTNVGSDFRWHFSNFSKFLSPSISVLEKQMRIQVPPEFWEAVVPFPGSHISTLLAQPMALMSGGFSYLQAPGQGSLETEVPHLNS